MNLTKEKHATHTPGPWVGSEKEAKIQDKISEILDEVLEFEYIIKENQKNIRIRREYLNRKYRQLSKLKEDA
tara:strand:+ start:196 stop:411 length:216 start_codon:yes stop_codon:yes gene_type:complete